MQLQTLHGVWQSRGYGWMLNIKADGYDFLHHAADHSSNLPQNFKEEITRNE